MIGLRKCISGFKYGPYGLNLFFFGAVILVQIETPRVCHYTLPEINVAPENQWLAHWKTPFLLGR